MTRALFILLIFTLLTTPTFFVYGAEPIRILLVPGHDDEVWGAQYGNVKEAEMNLALAIDLFNILKKDKRFKVYITRKWGGYTKEFEDYLSVHKDEISTFKEKAKAQMQAQIISGAFVAKESAPHNNVTDDIAIKLYGFNKWANENKIDAMIHVHFNDYARAQKWTIGKYTGFAIYEPEAQMANSAESALLAKNIYTQLKKKYTTSTYDAEAGGLVPDQKLIALGSNGTLFPSVRSVLIEYGYIYEKRFRTSSSRKQSFKNMANLTAAGINNYFFAK